MLLRIRPGVVPHDGWHYPVEIGEPIVGHSRDNLVDKLTDYRLANNIEVGDPRNDVDEYLCSKQPALCGETKQAIEKEPDTVRPLRSKVNDWIANRAQRKFNLVDRDETERRTAICLACPANQALVDPCAPCNANRKRQATIIRQNRNVDSDLKVCTILGHHNGVAVFLPKEGMMRAKEFLSETPEACWVRDLLK